MGEGVKKKKVTGWRLRCSRRQATATCVKWGADSREGEPARELGRGKRRYRLSKGITPPAVYRELEGEGESISKHQEEGGGGEAAVFPPTRRSGK